MLAIRSGTLPNTPRRERTTLPILVKGLLHPDDARRAVDIGLVDIAAAVGGRIPVIFDSGIRSGADIVKALALGADAVAVGRPHIYGLALAGRRGVTEVLLNLIAELDLLLALTGVRAVGELNAELLRRVG